MNLKPQATASQWCGSLAVGGEMPICAGCLLEGRDLAVSCHPSPCELLPYRHCVDSEYLRERDILECGPLSWLTTGSI